MMEQQPRLVVVSNRVPVPSKTGSSGAGGLSVALEAATGLLVVLAASILVNLPPPMHD